MLSNVNSPRQSDIPDVDPDDDQQQAACQSGDSVRGSICGRSVGRKGWPTAPACVAEGGPRGPAGADCERPARRKRAQQAPLGPSIRGLGEGVRGRSSPVASVIYAAYEHQSVNTRLGRDLARANQDGRSGTVVIFVDIVSNQAEATPLLLPKWAVSIIDVVRDYNRGR